jgi:hypothetical protein
MFFFLLGIKCLLILPQATLGTSGSFEKLQLSATFANGTRIPNGHYRVLVRALRVTGRPADERDYESWLSPIFGVQVPDKP